MSTLLIAIMGTAFSFLFNKYYTAQISLYPAKNEVMQGLGQFQSFASNFGMKMPDNNQNFNISDVVKSRLIAKKVLSQKWFTQNGLELSLFQLWEMDKPPWYSIIKSTILDSAFMTEKAIKKFSEHVEVIEDRLTGLITITVTLEDALISSNVANFIGDQVQLYIQKENSAQSTKEKLFISDRLSIVKTELETSELELKI